MAISWGNYSNPNLYYGEINKRSSLGLDINNEILLGLNDGFIGSAAWSNFDRWYSIDLNQEGVSGRHYIFMCRPDLNLVDGATDTTTKKVLNKKNGISEDPYFQYLGAYYPDIISSLTAEFNITSTSTRKYTNAYAGSGFGNSQYDSREGGQNMPIHTFIPFLTSRAESLQLPDYSIKTEELRQPFTRYGIPYPTSAIESQCSGDFDITFRDDKYLSIRKLFYAWIYYMDGVMRDKFTPKDKYIIYNCFDYATSIYDIQVDETGENVIWWTKYTGCFPYQVPLSDLSFNKGADPDPKCSISFKYYMCEPLSIASLIDFNYNSLGYRFMRKGVDSKSGRPIYSRDFMNPNLKFAPSYNFNSSNIYQGAFLGTNFVGRPCICIGDRDEYGKERKPANQHLGIKLKWLIKG